MTSGTYLFAREDENLVSSRAVPIVVVPGIMGTRLKLGKKRWDPDARVHSGSEWAWPRVDEIRRYFSQEDTPAAILRDGTECTDAEVMRGWSALSQVFYRDVLVYLDLVFRSAYQGIACPVYAFGYDWRGDNRGAAKSLVAYCRGVVDECAAESLILVSHSMGGYIAREAVRTTPWLKMLAAGVIHIGQPVLGAPVAYRRMLRGADIVFDDMSMRWLLGGGPEGVMRLFSAMPSALQLLPSDSGRGGHTRSYDAWMSWHREADGGSGNLPPVGDSVYDLYKYKRQPPALASNAALEKPIPSASEEWRQIYKTSRQHLSKNLGLARKFHKNLGLYHHPTTFTISGTQRKTDVRVVFRYLTMDMEGIDSMEFDDECVKLGFGMEGDGTVPLYSATGLMDEPAHTFEELDPEFFRQYQTPATHDEMCADSDVLTIVEHMVDTLLRAPASVLGGGRWRYLAAIVEIYREMKTHKDPLRRKSAEIELRVAKWYRERRCDVIVMHNPHGTKTPDLTVDGVTVDVKFTLNGGPETVEKEVRDGLKQGEKVLLVVGEGAQVTLAQARAIAKTVNDEHDGRVVVEVVDEATLPEVGDWW